MSLALPFAYPEGALQILALLIFSVVALGTAWIRGGRRIVAVCLALLLGFTQAAWQIGRALDARVPDCADRQVRAFTLTLLEDPLTTEDPRTGRVNARFAAELHADPAADCPGLNRHRVRMSWYDAPILTRGEEWRASGKLRPPWGYRNPAGFDYERWLLGAGLHGTGYVRAGELVQAAPADSALDSLRRALSRFVAAADLRHGSLVLALMLGDDRGISQAQWEQLRNSGTVHLLVVSGLHVGLIAAILYFPGRILVRIWPAGLRRFGARRLAAFLAMAGSGVYVALSGMGVPAVRAWLMSSLVLVLAMLGRPVAPGLLLVLVLFLILVADPLVVHQQGFWLSFSAVAVLVGFYAPRRYGQPPGGGRMLLRLRAFAGAQFVLFLGMGPPLALTLEAIPLLSPLANGFAVPVVSLCILPLVLLAGGLALPAPPLAGWLLSLADRILGWLMSGVSGIAAFEPVPVHLSWPELLLMAACLVMLGLAPGWRCLVLGMGLWLALLLPDGASPAPGHFRLTALDVGQGSAILVETARHTLLYDAGPAYPSGFDLGRAAVVPSFRRASRRALDGLILSHDDVDHTGGAASVIAALQPREVWRSFPSATGVPCTSGDGWEWDGVRFHFLHPQARGTARSRDSDNDSSCVLLVQARGLGALLAGDISARVERSLPGEPVTVLFAPHHGSRTSSSTVFVDRFRPELVLISTERRSRYGHPHPEVLERYAAVGARIAVTGWHGALTWESARPDRLLESREHERAYWHGGPWQDGFLQDGPRKVR